MYFDNAATTKPSKEVIADIVWCLENVWANPSSTHTPGLKARKLLEDSRAKVAKFINATPDEIIFTASGSESNNLAIKGFLEANHLYDCIVTTKIEHPSVYNTCNYVADDGWHRVVYTPIDKNGKVNIEKFELLMSELSQSHCCLVSLSLANNEIGTINDIKQLSQIAQFFRGVIHVDATQAVGQIPVDVKSLGCDLLTFSGHKLGVPRGTAVLYKHNRIHLSPMIHGGHQEHGYSAGTENLAGIYALGNQLERIGNVECNDFMCKYLLSKICSEITDCKIQLNGDLINRLPNNLSLTFSGINAEALIALLDLKGIYISAGAACSSSVKTPSRVLKAIGLSNEDAFSTIRISIDANTTREECDEFVKNLKGCLESLRMTS